MKNYPLLILATFLFTSTVIGQTEIDVQGHRGCRGLLPENSIPGFVEALKWANTLELDVVISKDEQVVISHEPYMSHEICMDTSGQAISEEQEKRFNIYEMTSAEIAEYDCGSTFVKRFPDQEKLSVSKPLLSALFDTIIALDSVKAMRYNIEIKHRPDWDGRMHPDIATYSQLLIDLIESYKLMDRVVIQSFNIEVLQHIHSIRPDIELVFLVQSLRGMKYNLRKLGFQPSVYSPYFKLLNKRQMRQAKRKGIRVIPWTVNTVEDIEKMLNLGVDGIISDYPNTVRECLKH